MREERKIYDLRIESAPVHFLRVLCGSRTAACACSWECLKESRVAWCARWNPICLKIVCVPLTWYHSRGEDDDVRLNAFCVRWKRRRRRRGWERSIDRSIWRMLPSVLVGFSHGSTWSLSPNAGYKGAQVCRVISCCWSVARSLAKFRVFCKMMCGKDSFVQESKNLAESIWIDLKIILLGHQSNYISTSS